MPCKLIVNNSSLPVFEYITDKRKDSVSIKDEEILLLIRTLNPIKAAGSEGIPGQMLPRTSKIRGRETRKLHKNNWG